MAIPVLSKLWLSLFTRDFALGRVTEVETVSRIRWIAMPSASLLRSNSTALFWVSLLGLFLEMALIRWVSTEIRIFAYCKNLVLLGCFLGLALGCYYHERRNLLAASPLLLLLVVGLVTAPFAWVRDHGPKKLTIALSTFADFHVWGRTEAGLAEVLFGVGWVVVVFCVTVLICYPFGQLVGKYLVRVEGPLRAYSTNIAGALAGIWIFTLLTQFSVPPWAWFLLVILGAIPFMPRGRARLPYALVVAAALVYLLVPKSQQLREHWSTYQKLTHIGKSIYVNNTGFMNLKAQPSFLNGAVPHHRRAVPYAFVRHPKKVLILGSGSGNDVAVALNAGAEEVVAVEIDPVVYRIAAEHHPQRPYQSDRVRVIVDDARHFLATTQEKFDLIIYGYLDAHTILSGYTNVRLDNFIYTVESFREARRILTDDGLLYVMYAMGDNWLAERFANNLSSAFGHPAVSFLWRAKWTLVHFLIGEPGPTDRVRADLLTAFPELELIELQPNETSISTDDWPYLHVQSHSIPVLILILIGTVVLVSLGGASALLLKSRSIQWQ